MPGRLTQTLPARQHTLLMVNDNDVQGACSVQLGTREQGYPQGREVTPGIIFFSKSIAGLTSEI